MTDAGHEPGRGLVATDVGAYCRAIEAHLCARNGGHRIRIVGPAFDLARAWHQAGIPLKVVERGIDCRVERAERRGVGRPLRLEYCDVDVQQAFADWRRAVGPMAAPVATDDAAAGGEGESTRIRSLPRHLDRVATRLSSAIVRMSEGPLRAFGTSTLEQIGVMRATAPRLRGEARDAVIEVLSQLDASWNAAVLEHGDPRDIARARAEADRDLATYRGRMPADEYARAADGLAARAVREVLGLPRLAP